MSLLDRKNFWESPKEEREYYELERKGLIGSRITNFPTSRPLVNGKEGRKIEPIRLAEIPEPGPRIELVERILPKGHLSTLYGDGGQGKSLLALILGTAVATGGTFMDLQCQKNPVLFLDWELDVEEHARRSYAVARGMGLQKPPDGFFYLRAEDHCLDLMAGVKDFVAKEGVGLVVVDSFGAACGGDPDAQTVIPFLSALRTLQTTVFTIDHQPKMQEGQDFRKKSPYGSAYKFNFARSVLHCHKVAGRPGELSLLLRHTKFNFGPLRDEQPLRLLFSDGMVCVEKGDMANDPSFIENLPTDKRIEQALKKEGPATARTLAERLGVSAKTVVNITSRLKKEGKIEESGKEGHAPIYNFLPSILLGSGRQEENFDQEVAIEATAEWAENQQREPGEEG